MRDLLLGNRSDCVSGLKSDRNTGKVTYFLYDPQAATVAFLNLLWKVLDISQLLQFVAKTND